MKYEIGQKVKLPYLAAPFDYVGRVGKVIFVGKRTVTVHNGLYPEGFWIEDIAPYDGDAEVGEKILYENNYRGPQILSVCTRLFSNRVGAKA